VGRLHLLCNPFVRLFGALANRFTVPVEFVPPAIRSLLFIDGHPENPFPQGLFQDRRISQLFPTPGFREHGFLANAADR
jgi:hypothetical protein